MRRFRIWALLAVLVATPQVTEAACCACTNTAGTVECPAGAQQCFTTFNDPGPCQISACSPRQCFGTNFDALDTCGVGNFAACAVIDRTPVATKTATVTNTATATATATATSTSTATGTNTPTPSPVPQGGACTTASQCSTLNCARGVCCDTACDGPEQQCNLPGQVGTCASTAAPAPAASNTGLLVMLGVLIVAAFVAMRMRRA